MFARIAGVVGIGLLAVLALDFFILRRRFPNRPSIFWELAPVFGFSGAILLGLAFVEASRREVMDAWRWGLALGLGLTLVAGVVWWLRAGVRRESKERGWRAWLRMVQAYGVVALVGVLGVVIAVRVIGALLEVFLASALGVLAMAYALGIFIVGWRQRAAPGK